MKSPSQAIRGAHSTHTSPSGGSKPEQGRGAEGRRLGGVECSDITVGIKFTHLENFSGWLKKFEEACSIEYEAIIIIYRHANNPARLRRETLFFLEGTERFC